MTLFLTIMSAAYSRRYRWNHVKYLYSLKKNHNCCLPAMVQYAILPIITLRLSMQLNVSYFDVTSILWSPYNIQVMASKHLSHWIAQRLSLNIVPKLQNDYTIQKTQKYENASMKNHSVEYWILQCPYLGTAKLFVCFQWGTEEKSSQLSEYRRQAPMVLTFPGK